MPYSFRPGHHVPDHYTPPPGRKMKTPEEKMHWWVKAGWWVIWLAFAFELGRVSAGG